MHHRSIMPTLSTPSLARSEFLRSTSCNHIPSSISILYLQYDCCRCHHVQASSSWLPELWPSPSSNVAGNGLCRPATSLLAEHPSPCVFLCSLNSAQPLLPLLVTFACIARVIAERYPTASSRDEGLRVGLLPALHFSCDCLP